MPTKFLFSGKRKWGSPTIKILFHQYFDPCLIHSCLKFTSAQSGSPLFKRSYQTDSQMEMEMNILKITNESEKKKYGDSCCHAKCNRFLYGQANPIMKHLNQMYISCGAWNHPPLVSRAPAFRMTGLHTVSRGSAHRTFPSSSLD